MARDAVQVGWAALGAGFGVVLSPIEWFITESFRFPTTRRNLESTVERVSPVIQEMRRWDNELDRQTDETQSLLEDLERGQRLVSEGIPVLGWFCLPCYQLQFQEAYDALVRNFTLFTPAETARDTREMLSMMRNNFGIQCMGPCLAPEIPDKIVGLEQPFHKLKQRVLEKSGGVSVLVLTGLAGSGKTTLASLICKDDHVTCKFGKNIFFVTVSKTPDLKIIVQTIFQHSRRDVPILLNDDHAVIQLRRLLKEIGKSPMMMVLDDVWHGSEPLIEAFQVQLPEYKILVTSRIEFPRFRPAACQLKELGPNDSVTLFRHFALNDGKSYNPNEDLVQQVAKSCWGSPLALKLVGRSLCGQPKEVWEKMQTILCNGHSIVVSNIDLLSCLEKCLDDVLEDKPFIKECFMDLGLFPEDQKIPVAALVDIWTELDKLDVGDIDSMNNVHELTRRHLVNLVATREVASDVDNYYNHHFLTQHDLLREIAIHQARQEPYEQRKRLIFDTNESYWPLQNQQQAVARTLSISTDEMDTPNWCNMLPAEVFEVLVLNLRTKKYTLPEFMKKMSELKVVIITNYDGFNFSELNNFEILSSVSSLKRIRLQQVSVPPLGKLNNLRKLSLYMCDTSQVFQNVTISISDALPNLEEMSIDYSIDLVELPAELCKITTLKKLSITKCGKFSVVPQEIGNLMNLEILRLSSCSVLGELPSSIGRLGQLGYLDISYCVSLVNLPEEIGDLDNLKKLHMTGCSLRELPWSVRKLEHLRSLICNEESAALWEHFKPSLPNLEIKETDINVPMFI